MEVGIIVGQDVEGMLIVADGCGVIAGIVADPAAVVERFGMEACIA